MQTTAGRATLVQIIISLPRLLLRAGVFVDSRKGDGNLRIASNRVEWVIQYSTFRDQWTMACVGFPGLRWPCVVKAGSSRTHVVDFRSSRTQWYSTATAECPSLLFLTRRRGHFPCSGGALATEWAARDSSTYMEEVE